MSAIIIIQKEDPVIVITTDTAIATAHISRLIESRTEFKTIYSAQPFDALTLIGAARISTESAVDAPSSSATPLNKASRAKTRKPAPAAQVSKNKKQKKIKAILGKNITERVRELLRKVMEENAITSSDIAKRLNIKVDATCASLFYLVKQKEIFKSGKRPFTYWGSTMISAQAAAEQRNVKLGIIKCAARNGKEIEIDNCNPNPSLDACRKCEHNK